MSDFADFILDLISYTRISRHPLILIGVILTGVGIIVLLTVGLSAEASTGVLLGGFGAVLLGIAMVASGVWRWSVQDHLK